ncbi:MAG: hypothetical protein IPM57_08280 [Oligoflexia bacterium]|nr:hypothetical protein [Oligoflexia bacterium]
MKYLLLAIMSITSLSAFGGYEIRYPITCRGGEMNEFNFRYFPNSMALLTLEFIKSKGQSTQELKPGECRWDYRQFKNDDPSMICHFVKDLDIKLIRSAGNNFNIQNINSESAPYVAAAFNDANKYFRMLVFKDDSLNCLTVSATLP